MRRIWILGLVFLLLSSVLPTAVTASSEHRYRLTVVFRGNALPAGARGELEKTGAKVIGGVPEVGVIEAEGSSNLIPLLQKVTGVQYVAPSLTWQLQIRKSMVHPNSAPSATAGPGDLYSAFQWDIKQVTENGASWRINSGSHRTAVGIIDTGVNTLHRDLAANLLGGRNFVPAGTNGDPSETGDPNDYVDRFGHGSHVAGSIAGNGRIYGVGPNLGFRSYRVFGADGGADTSWITAAMIAAANDGVDVISMSLGGYDVLGKVTWTDPTTGQTYDLGDDHADLVAWKRAFHYVSEHDIVVVAAAGNDGIDAGNPRAVIDFLNGIYGPQGYHFQGQGFEVPAGIRGAVAVSATGPDSNLTSYSNYGKGFITVAAPGGDFKRYPVGDWYTDMCLSAYMDPGDGLSHYIWMAGTSMAAPKAAATAALFIDQQKKGGERPDPEETIRQLRRGAIDLGRPGYDPYFGYGLVNAYRTLKSAGKED